MKFSTQIEDSLNVYHGKFGVSNSNPQVPLNVQIWNNAYEQNFRSSDSLAHSKSNEFLVFGIFWKIKISEFILDSFFMNIQLNHLQTMLTKSYRIKVDQSNHFQLTCKRIRRAWLNGCKALSLQCFSIFRPNLVCFDNHDLCVHEQFQHRAIYR